MSDSRQVTLGDIASLSNGSNFTKKSFGSGLKILGVRDFGDRTSPEWEAMDEVDPTALSSNLQLLAEGDLVFVRSNGNPALVGRSMLITQGPTATHSAFTIKARPDTDLVAPRFLGYQMRYAHRAGLMRAANGTNITNLSQAVLSSVPVLLPSLDTQLRVQTILGSIDDLIENNRRRVQKLEEMARAIYREWFVHFRYPGHENVSLANSALGPIPESWWVGTVGDLVDIVKETLDPSSLDPETPAVGLEHIPRRKITLDNWGRAGDLGSRKATFKKGDILFGKIRPYFHKVSVAALDGICSTDAIVMRPNAVHWGEAVAVMASDEFVEHATQTSNGTKMPRADWKVIGNYPVAIPPSPISSSFTQLIRNHLDMADRLMFESRRLAEMRDLLLPKLVTGQIDVSALDLDGLPEGAVA